MSSTSTLPAIVYPESDGLPMAENTRQYQVIVCIKENLEVLYRDAANVFIAADNFWYPQEGHPEIVQAPDVYVVFGRPKGDRSSYRQWEEDGFAPQVVFETLSPGNRHGEMVRKFEFYERYGVEEYYVYDPDHKTLDGWLRHGNHLRAIPKPSGWHSPRLGIRFELTDDGLKLFYPDGRPFLTTLELDEQRRIAEQRAAEAQQKIDKAQQQAKQAEEQAKQAEERAKQAEERASRLAAQLRALGKEPDA